MPSKFSMVKQNFGTPFDKVPANDWDTPNGLDTRAAARRKSED